MFHNLADVSWKLMAVRILKSSIGLSPFSHPTSLFLSISISISISLQTNGSWLMSILYKETAKVAFEKVYRPSLASADAETFHRS